MDEVVNQAGELAADYIVLSILIDDAASEGRLRRFKSMIDKVRSSPHLQGVMEDDETESFNTRLEHYVERWEYAQKVLV